MSNISQSTVQNQLSILLRPTTPFLVLSYAVSSIAILLNGIEIKLIVTNIKKATDFEIVLLNLAIADFFNSILFIASSAITQKAKNGQQTELNYSYYWVTAILTFSVLSSVSFVTVIGIERFFAIKVPLQHRMWHTSRKRLITCLIFMWLFNVILITSLSITDHVIEGRNKQILSSTRTYVFTSLITVGCIIILVLYTWVLHLMMLRSLKLFDFDKKVLRVNQKMIKETMKKEKSSIIICILVVVSFLMCTIPLITDLFQLRLTLVSGMLLKLLPVANPLIYFFKGYLEKYYARKKLVSSYEEKDKSKGNEKRGQGSTDKTGKDHKTDSTNYDGHSIAQGDMIIGSFDNIASIEEERSQEEHLKTG